MKFCNVYPTAYHLRCVKGKTNTFFHLPFSHEAVVSETMIVFVCYLLLAPHHVPFILFKQWHREERMRESESAQVIHKALSQRASALEWTERPTGPKGPYSSFNEYTPTSLW